MAKKYERKSTINYNKKLTVPRNTNLLISYDKGQVKITNEDGVPYDLGQQSMVRYYQGENKKRIIAQATNLDFITDQVGSWPENFDYIFAIDTNTHPQKCDDFLCSVGVVCYGEVSKVSYYERSMLCKPYMVIDWYHPQSVKIETATWMESIKIIQKKIPADKRIGIVIDSELGKLEGYNNRTVPVYGDLYLPQNYTLMYATADASDEWCNKIIKHCDKTATQRLQEVIAEPKLKYNPAGSIAPIGLIYYLNDQINF